ncbi:MAG: hypothetical protein M3R08_04675 [Bacteroidota bacterium]|nr:hypothetical protein [Bacteroidota bacterium]
MALVFIWGSYGVSLGQSLEYHPCSTLRNDYIQMCKVIATIPALRNHTVLEENGKIIYVLSKSDYIVDQNERIAIPIDDDQLRIWFLKEIFFYDIPYWIEIQYIQQEEGSVKVKFRSFTSVNEPIKRKVVKGEALLVCEDSLLRLKDFDLELP